VYVKHDLLKYIFAMQFNNFFHICIFLNGVCLTCIYDFYFGVLHSVARTLSGLLNLDKNIINLVPTSQKAQYISVL
jgi:hypothetical protein